ncbi:class I SAM-dependent DNA methyltransferase [Kitasatospora viridis]|uniref:Nodulation protein S (NodS) n=1 Tax=Kitasatospora viridis TaxID=281105 RepID=A0A561SDU4_9ACTN|nr:SAM-dependent methyltransferase [Kitasatospora viridis]TWF73043.1 nodulation protein S (NodS) [Kitasatospora viridis]
MENPGRHPADTAHFETIYARHEDPWGTLQRPYEREKFADTLAMIPTERVSSAFEVGCGVGALTELLAPRCESLLAVDCSPSAVRRARIRCGSLPQVDLQVMRVPEDLPDRAQFDLVVLSEVCYYLSPAELSTTIATVTCSLRPGGHVLLVHWQHGSAEHKLSGEEVHEAFIAAPGLRRIEGRTVTRYGNTYRTDLLQRRARPPLR